MFTIFGTVCLLGYVARICKTIDTFTVEVKK